MTSNYRNNRGFTLVEVLVALAIVATISYVLMSSLGPWLNLKQKADTERRLQDIKQGISAIYEAEAMAIESSPASTFKGFANSSADAGSGGCALDDAPFKSNSTWFSEPGVSLARDGYSNPWCVRISSSLTALQDGVTLWYRNVHVLSTGLDGKLDAATVVAADGTLTLGGDDVGVTVSGREVQGAKLRETLRRMTRVGRAYETYFTVRYLANASRDITVDYFSSAYDAGGTVASTGGGWAPATTALAGIGVAGLDALSAWDSLNDIEVGNSTESVNGATARSPASTGVGALPFTALLRARVPAPAGTFNYALQGVVGNY